MAPAAPLERIGQILCAQDDFLKTGRFDPSQAKDCDLVLSASEVCNGLTGPVDGAKLEGAEQIKPGEPYCTSKRIQDSYAREYDKLKRKLGTIKPAGTLSPKTLAFFRQHPGTHAKNLEKDAEVLIYLIELTGRSTNVHEAYLSLRLLSKALGKLSPTWNKFLEFYAGRITRDVTYGVEGKLNSGHKSHRYAKEFMGELPGKFATAYTHALYLWLTDPDRLEQEEPVWDLIFKFGITEPNWNFKHGFGAIIGHIRQHLPGAIQKQIEEILLRRYGTTDLVEVYFLQEQAQLQRQGARFYPVLKNLDQKKEDFEKSLADVFPFLPKKIFPGELSSLILFSERSLVDLHDSLDHGILQFLRPSFYRRIEPIVLGRYKRDHDAIDRDVLRPEFEPTLKILDDPFSWMASSYNTRTGGLVFDLAFFILGQWREQAWEDMLDLRRADTGAESKVVKDRIAQNAQELIEKFQSNPAVFTLPRKTVGQLTPLFAKYLNPECGCYDKKAANALKKEFLRFIFNSSKVIIGPHQEFVKIKIHSESSRWDKIWLENENPLYHIRKIHLTIEVSFPRERGKAPLKQEIIFDLR